MYQKLKHDGDDDDNAWTICQWNKYLGIRSIGIPCAHHVGDDDNDDGDDEDVDAGLAMLWRRKLVGATQVTQARGAFIILCAMP